jgi:glycosyltransferase involved in cell wall biosynthesis
MKVALVHDWFQTNSGAERVFSAILNSFRQESIPEKVHLTLPPMPFTIPTTGLDVFSLFDFLNEQERSEVMNGMSSRTSFIQSIPYAKKYYRHFLPLFQLAIGRFDLSQYDLILSSSWAVAKSVKKKPGQLHVCYCHTPMRYIWDMEEFYLDSITGLSKSLVPLIRRHFRTLRDWDKKTSVDVDFFMANSGFVAERIKRIYHKESAIIYPPVNTRAFIPSGNPQGDYYITVSRLVEYKNTKMIVEAAKQLNIKLLIIGEGPLLKKIKRYASEQIKVLGYCDQPTLVNYLQHAKAYIAASEEDFGIAAVEAQACGIPVIAYSKGGFKETVIEGKTGIFFDRQTVESVKQGILDFENAPEPFDRLAIRRNALRFSEELFNEKFTAFLLPLLNERTSKVRVP